MEVGWRRQKTQWCRKKLREMKLMNGWRGVCPSFLQSMITVSVTKSNGELHCDGLDAKRRVVVV